MHRLKLVHLWQLILSNRKTIKQVLFEFIFMISFLVKLSYLESLWQQHFKMSNELYISSIM